MSHSDGQLFAHIFDEMRFLEAEVARTGEAAFLVDETLKRAFARSLEIIGEAVKNLSPSLVTGHPEVPWRNIAGMRDKLIHGYFSTNHKLVWDVASRVLPEFQKQLAAIQSQHPELFP